MMNKKIIIILVAVISFLPAAGQNQLEQLLVDIEANNPKLKAEAYAAQGRSYEARMGNSLEPLEVSYGALWGQYGNPERSGELEVSQSFDLPMLYATRSKIARNMAQQYEAEYLALRQEILLEATEIYYELCALHEIFGLAELRLEAGLHIAELYAARYETGDATFVEKNRIDLENLVLRESLTAIYREMTELELRLVVLNGGERLYHTYEKLPHMPLMPVDELFNDWREYAPEMTVLRLQEEEARYGVRLSKQEALPKVTLGYKHEYGPGERFNGIVAGLNIPIFSNRFNVKRAKAMEQAARINMEAAVIELEYTLINRYANAQSLEYLLSSFETMPGVEEYIGMLGRLLETGEIDIVEYYSEMNAYYDARETALSVDMAYRKEIARLHVIYM